MVERQVKCVILDLEFKAAPLSYCFNAIPYSSKAISVIETMNFMRTFYPFINKKTLFFVVKELDSNLNGFIDYGEMVDFLYKYSEEKVSFSYKN
jgi:hypothetical protein